MDIYKTENKQLKYIDLFAEIGGFQIALDSLGHKSFFASELKVALANLYNNNFGIKPNRDITKISVDDILEHDILCEGIHVNPSPKWEVKKA